MAMLLLLLMPATLYAANRFYPYPYSYAYPYPYSYPYSYLTLTLTSSLPLTRLHAHYGALAAHLPLQVYFP